MLTTDFAKFIVITLIVVASLVLSPANPELVASQAVPQLGFHIGRGDASHLAGVRAAGGTFAVVVFDWASIEPEPNYLYWEVSDAALRAAEFHNIQIVARLDRPPAWALDDLDPTPWRLEAYGDFVRRVVERYDDRLAGVIIWNEPNLTLEWNNQSPDPAAYVDLLNVGYTAVKAVKPDMPVVSAGLAFTQDNDLN